MSDQSSTTDSCTLDVARFFEHINDGRKMLSLPPVEYGAMASRCNLRFNLNNNRGIDFNQETVTIALGDVDALEELVNDQFNCHFEGDVARLCIRQKNQMKPATELNPVMPEMKHKPRTQPHMDKESGLLSKIKNIFGGE